MSSSKNFSRNFEKISRYYETLTFNPITLSNVYTLSLYTIPKSKLLLFLLSRSVFLANMFQNMFLLFGLYNYKFGKLDVFGNLEALLWIFAYMVPMTHDIVHLNPALARSLNSLIKTCNHLWTTTTASLSPLSVNQIQKTLTRNWKRIWIHNSLLDYFEIILYALSLWASLEYRTLWYSMFPWKCNAAKIVTWILQALAFFVYYIGVSNLMCSHSIIAYHISACLEALTYGEVYDEQICTSNVLRHYQTLTLVTRLWQKHVSFRLLLFFLVAGLDLFVQNYVCFQLIKFGAGLNDTIFMFMDLAITLSRFWHTFYALASIHTAGQAVFTSVRKSFIVSKLTWARRKEERKIMKSLPPISFKLGPIECTQSFVLAGMEVYAGYYATAALWP